MTPRATASRRTFIAASAASLASAILGSSPALLALPRVRVAGFDLLPVRATERTVWLFVRLRTDAGLIGLGEASDAFGFANTTKQDAARMEAELQRFVRLIEAGSALDVQRYRHLGMRLAAEGGLIAATAFSAVEQAMWDLAGKALSVPAF